MNFSKYRFLVASGNEFLTELLYLDFKSKE